MKYRNAAAVAVTAFLFTGAAAQAADIISETPQPPEAVIIETASNWSGLYLGVAGGGFWADANSTGLDFPPSEDIDFDESGLTASIYGGYNWQVNSFVFGVEGEVSWLDLEFGANRNPGPWTYLSADWSATVSGRAGYLFSPEILAYGKLGYTWTDFEAGSWGAAPDLNIDDGIVGAVQVGAGIEAMLTSNLILRGEVAYNFAMDDVTISYGTNDYVYEPDYGTAKIGIAYKF